MTIDNVIIIAEAGVNHNGDLELAKKLVDVAADAGADYVKFQTFISEKLVSKFATKAQYQKTNTHDEDTSQLEMLQKLELNHEMHTKLIEYCKLKNIKFLSTAFDLESIDYLHSLNIDTFKIPSGEITNLPHLEKIGSIGKPIILSTGMANLIEIEDALSTMIKAGAKREDITVLHCNTEYPTPMRDVNLRAMLTIKNTCNVAIGYSDHTLGIEVPVAAVAMGATIIEKHFTLDRTLDGPDHAASLEPSELKSMVQAIRNIQLALGSHIKSASESEIKNINTSRKSIVAAINIKKGDIFTESNIAAKRPGNGISPMKWHEIIGKKAIRDFLEDELIEL